MKTVSTIIVTLGLLATLRADPAGAGRRDERPRAETGRVVLYSGENFDGVSIELLPGAEIADLNDLRFSDGRKVDDRISSVRVFGGLTVALYADPGFSGEALELSGSSPRLGRVPRRGGNWDNCLSSVRVSGGRGDGHDHDRPPARDPRHWDPDRDGRPGGYSGHDDRPRRPEGPSGAEIERLVTRAYRDLLAREPTDSELRKYREAVEEQGWGRDEICDDLRGGREYRTKEANALIERVYREMFGREVDGPSRKVWLKRLVEKGWDERRFRAEMRKFDEYRVNQERRAREGRKP